MRKSKAERSYPNKNLTDFVSEKQIQNKVTENEKVPNSGQHIVQTFKMSNQKNLVPSHAANHEINDTALKDALTAIVKKELPKVAKEEFAKVAKNFGATRMPSKKGNDRVLYLRKKFFQKFQKTHDEAPKITVARIVGAAQLGLQQVRSLDDLEDRIKQSSEF